METLSAKTGTVNSPREFLLSERTTSFGDTLQLQFVTNREYPFEVIDSKGGMALCISYAEALDMYEHWYTYMGAPNGV